MTIFQCISVLAAAAIGGYAAWILRNKTHSELLHLLLSFTGAYLLSVTVLHLLPDVFAEGNGQHIALYILLGFFIQLIIVQFTRGIEHGHLHLHEHVSQSYVVGVIFGLSLHAFMEGIPLSVHADSLEPNNALFYAILIHKIPETFALSALLFFSKRKQIISCLLIAMFACMTPLGSLLGNYFAKTESSINWLIAIVVGTFIHISTTIIFEASGKAHKMSVYKIAAILIGAGIALLTLHT